MHTASLSLSLLSREEVPVARVPTEALVHPLRIALEFLREPVGIAPERFRHPRRIAPKPRAEVARQARLNRLLHEAGVRPLVELERAHERERRRLLAGLGEDPAQAIENLVERRLGIGKRLHAAVEENAVQHHDLLVRPSDLLVRLTARVALVF